MKKEENLSIDGVVDKITGVSFHINGVSTTFRIKSDPEKIVEFEKDIDSLEEQFKYDPVYRLIAHKEDAIELIFRGTVHEDIIGKKFDYKITILNPYRAPFSGNLIVQQLLSVEIKKDNNRIYFSEFYKD